MCPVQASETTGSLTGIVLSKDEQPLPGATITVSSPSLMSERETIAKDAGHFRLVFLPPGKYSVTVSLDGFAKTTKVPVVVALGLKFLLEPASIQETIEVVAAAPVIDTSITTVGGNITDDEFEQLPTSRRYQDVAALVGGVDNSMGDYDEQLKDSPTFNGSSAPENNYIIDGLTTTDALFGTSGTHLTFNFIEEVEIISGGYAAEFGRATGGIINVITKSGGNEFSGSLFAFLNTYDMNGSGKYQRYRGVDTDWIGNQYSDFGGDLGGYLIKDKLWFF
ncbi:carboxypeptidase regulatory-like domain-containing protein, partial [candidate division CSSED10-310 bacterium]